MATYPFDHSKPNIHIEYIVDESSKTCSVSYQMPNPNSIFGYSFAARIIDNNGTELCKASNGIGGMEHYLHSSGIANYGSASSVTFQVYCGQDKEDIDGKTCTNSWGSKSGDFHTLQTVNLYTAPKDLVLSLEARTTRTLTFKPTWTEGTVASTCEVTCNKVTKTVKNGSTIKFEDLTPDTKYTADAVTNDGTTTLNKSKDGTTYSAIKDLNITATPTGKTIAATVTWTAGNWTDNKYNLELYYKKGTSASDKDTLAKSSTNLASTTESETNTIKSLENDTTYALYAKLTDTAKENTLTKLVTVLTYGASLSVLDTSTKAVKFTMTANKNGASLQYKITGGNADNKFNTYSGDTTGAIVDMLDHNVKYTITYRTNNLADTEKTTTFSTKKLSVMLTASSYTTNSITTSWQAQADGKDYDKDNITGTKIKFNDIGCVGFKHADDTTNNYTYQTPITNGTNKGDYEKDKTIICENLDYWAWYKITCYITDGHNIVSAYQDLHTDFPYTKLYVNNKWVNVMPYVYTGGRWVNSPAHVYNNHVWAYNKTY